MIVPSDKIVQDYAPDGQPYLFMLAGRVSERLTPRDPSDPCNPLLTYAQKPRTEAEEKSCSSHCRAKEAVR